jgi:hypothetical protein
VHGITAEIAILKEEEKICAGLAGLFGKAGRNPNPVYFMQ